MKIKIEFTVEVDAAAYASTYGADDIRADVKAHAWSMVDGWLSENDLGEAVTK